MTGAMAIKVTIWLAMGLYALSGVMRLRSVYVLGLLAYLAHVAAVFHFAHGWSHAAAFEYTAARTEEATGIRFGGGLYVNYAFTVLWILDAAWWLVSPTAYVARPRWMSVAVHAVFLFMIFNATVVFGTGPVRWYGGIVCGVAALTIICRCR